MNPVASKKMVNDIMQASVLSCSTKKQQMEKREGGRETDCQFKNNYTHTLFLQKKE
jgi:hypothetical protein